MEIIELIFSIAVFAINTFAVCFITTIVSKWNSRMEKKLNDIKDYIKHVTDRNDIVFINQLESIKRELVKHERYEEARKISKLIEDEYKKLKIE